MCGIVGMAGDISSAQITGVFRDLLDVGQIRGRDSTGVIKVAADCESYTSAKLVGPPAFLCDTRMYEKRIEQGGAPAVLVGHLRAKTIGETNNKNAHPFDFPEEGIIGVHNGTLKAYHNLPGRVHNETDSESMYRYLANNGPEDTFSRIEGAWACVWWNQNEKTLNFIRNSERPLWFTWSKDFRILAWASELWMLSAFSRKVELWQPEKEGETKFMQIPEDTLWSWQIDSRAEPSEKVMTLKQPKKIIHKPPTYYCTGGSRFHREPQGWAYDDELKSYVRPRQEKKGGEVPDPFQEALREIDSQLNDPLPPHLRNTNAKVSSEEDNSSTKIGNVEFLKHSPASMGSSTGMSASKSSSKSILSLPAKNSPNSRQSNNVVPLEKSGKHGVTQQTKECSRQDKSLKPFVDFRTVAGIRYITDNSTGKEYDEPSFMHRTGGKCGFCKTTVDSIRNVGTIINDNLFVCSSCISSPSEEEAGPAPVRLAN